MTGMNELPFRVWSELAASLGTYTAQRDNTGLVRELLSPVADGTVYLRQKDDGGLCMDVSLSPGEARAHTAYLKCPSQLSPHEPIRWAEHVAVRIGDHLHDEEFLRDLALRLSSLAPYKPDELDDFLDWHWYFGERHHNLLIADGRLVLPPGWEYTGAKIGPIFCQTTHLRLIDGQGRMGLMAQDGVMTVPCRYAYLGEPDGWGRILVCEANNTEIPLHRGGQSDLIDEHGNRINPAGTKVRPGSLWHGYAVAFHEGDTSGAVGLMASDGRTVGGIRWKSVYEFSENLAVVQDLRTRLLGYIDKAGEVVIEPVFAKVHDFDRGYAVVSPAGADDRFGLIDPKGTLVIQPVWKDMRWFLGSYFHVTATDGAIGLIDTQGRAVIEPHHPSPEEQEQIDKSESYIRGHPFAIALGNRLRGRVEAALAGSATLAPVEGMLASGGMSDIELASCGLRGRSVTLVADYVTGLGFRIPDGDRGWIGFSYPASASIFNFAIEAPVEGLEAFKRGSIGIPWRLLKFADR